MSKRTSEALTDTARFFALTPALLTFALALASPAVASVVAGSPQFLPTPFYSIKTFVYFCSNDDGSQAATTTAAEFEHMVVYHVNGLLAPAGIRLLFDPTTDWTTLNNTMLNHEFDFTGDVTTWTDPNVKPPEANTSQHRQAREDVARLSPDRLVFFFIYGDRWQWGGDELGHWILLPRKGGSSSHEAWLINLPHDCTSWMTTGHEVGENFHQDHPQNSHNVRTPAEAAAEILRAVEAGEVTEDNGDETFNGDRLWVQDTVPDPGGPIMEYVNFLHGFGREKCGPYDHVPVTVHFPDGSRNYTLRPDRHNIMSYFFCPPDQHFSHDQVRRIRDAIENLNRQRLVTIPLEDLDVGIARKGSFTGGTLGSGDMGLTRTDSRQVVAAYSTSTGYLKLRVWNVTGDGEPQVGGSYTAPEKVGSIAAVSMGLGMVATAVYETGTARLKVILWKVSEDGQTITRMSDAGIRTIGAGHPVAAARMHRDVLATAAEGLEGDLDGKLVVDLWRIDANGNITLAGSGVGENVTGGYSICEASWNRVATAQRGDSNLLKVIIWELTGDGLVRKGSASGGNITDVEATTIDTDFFTTSARLSTGVLEISAWGVTRDGEVHLRTSTQGSFVGNSMAGIRLGSDALVTAVRTFPGQALKLTLWKIDRPIIVGSYSITKQAETNWEAVLGVSISRVDRGSVATAVSDQTGAFRLIVWELTRPVANEPPLANDDTATIDNDVTSVLPVLNNDIDGNGDPLTITGVSQGGHGSVTTDGTTASYVPNVGYVGADTFTYNISDGRGGSDTATVTLTILQLARISGRVRTSLGLPLNRVRITLRSGGTLVMQVRTGILGTFVMTDVGPGSYTLRARKAGWHFSPARRNFSINGIDCAGKNFRAYPQ